MAPTNPILPGCHPDPSICCVGGNYFAVTSSFEFFPGLPIYHSTNLVDWRLIGHALNRSSQLSLSAIPGSAGVWAPTLRYHNGRFYIVTSIMRRRWVREVSHKSMLPAYLQYSPRPFYIETDDIWKEATWSDPTYFDVHGIDPDVSWRSTLVADSRYSSMTTVSFTFPLLRSTATPSLYLRRLLRNPIWWWWAAKSHWRMEAVLEPPSSFGSPIRRLRSQKVPICTSGTDGTIC